MTEAINPEAIDMSVYRWEKTNPDVDCEVLAKQMVAELPLPALTPVVERLLTDRLADHRRQRARRAEEDAQRGLRSEERRKLNEYADKEYAEKPWDAPSGTRLYQQWKRVPEKEQVSRRVAADPKFARFVAESDERDHLDGLSYAGWQMREAMTRFQQETREEVLLELTADLLSAEFALGDGCVVTWGEATAGQHRQRFDMLMAHAAGSMHSAQRHVAAVKLLEEHKAACLAEIGPRA